MKAPATGGVPPGSSSATPATTGTGAPSVERRPGLFHGWKIVGSGASLIALQSALILQAFGNYAVIFEERYGWSKTSISVAYSFNRAESGLLGPIHGWTLDRFGSKRMMRVGAVIVFFGFFAFSQIQSATQLIGAFFLVAVGSSLSGFMTVVTETVKWFERKRARALAWASMGLVGGGLGAPGVVWCMRNIGWRETAFASGVVLSGLALVLASLYGSSPAAHGTHVDGVHPDDVDVGRVAPDVGSSVHFTAAEAVRTKAFWLLSLGHSSALFVVGAVVAHLSLFLTEEHGYSLQSASFVAAGLPVAQLGGQLTGGAVGDRVSKRLLCIGAMFGHMTALLLLTFAVGAVMIWAFVVIHGFSWGLRGPLVNALRADYFGSTSYGKIMGFASIVLMIGMVGGPLLAGALADATGSYQTGFTILALLAGAGSIFFVLMSPPADPARTAPDHDGPGAGLRTGR